MKERQSDRQVEMETNGEVTRVRRRRLSPTDVSAFVRQDHCHRHLRLSMLERRQRNTLFAAHDVRPQPLSPLLDQIGRDFERRVEAAIESQMAVRRFGRQDLAGRDENDNAVLLRAARGLVSGERVGLLQARLLAEIGGWELFGFADFIMLERDLAGRLTILIADIKSSTEPKLEHQLQVAFYAEMIATIFAMDETRIDRLELAILYRPPEIDHLLRDPELRERVSADRTRVRLRLGTEVAAMARVEDADALRQAAHDLVLDPGSDADEIARQPFDDVAFHLQPVCDGCAFNEFCLKWSAVHDDLSLIPFLDATSKAQLRAAGVTTTAELAGLKRLPEPGGPVATGPGRYQLSVAPGREATVRALTRKSPVGPHLDDLIYRAMAYRQAQGDDIRAPRTIPGSGRSSMPLVDATTHSNLVWVYLNAETDYLNDRLYLLSARVVACENGEPARQASIIEMTDGPPEDAAMEAELIRTWAGRVISTICTLAAPDPETGAARAPIHLVLFSKAEADQLLDALSRHLEDVFGATALYDFVSQAAALSSPLVTLVATDFRLHRNESILGQSLLRLSTRYGFAWNEPRPFRSLFGERVFDYVGKLKLADSDEGAWYTRRARFRSSIPLEYAYGIWGKLPSGREAGTTPPSAFLAPTRDDFLAFVDRRLDALIHVAGVLDPDRDAGKAPFDLPDLATYEARARNLGEALLEFIQVERQVDLAEWKRIRQLEPERRMAMAQAWVTTFHDADQSPDDRAALESAREADRRFREVEARRQAAGEKLSADERKLRPKVFDRPLRFRINPAADGTSFDDLLAMSELHEGDHAVRYERLTVDSRLPAAEQVPSTPTPRQLLHGPRVRIDAIGREPDLDGASVPFLTAAQQEPRGKSGGFTYGWAPRNLQDGERYTFDPSPDDWSLASQFETINTIVAKGRRNALFERLAGCPAADIPWPDAAAAGQQRFMDGLDALNAAGLLHGFEPAKRAFIEGHGADPILLVQGPPGTGKSYTTALAMFARIQGAMAAGMDFRIAASCKTHAAVDVLMTMAAETRGRLAEWRRAAPDIFDRYFDARLLDVPILRGTPRQRPPAGIEAIWPSSAKDDPLFHPEDRTGRTGLNTDGYLLLFSTPSVIRHIDGNTERTLIQCLFLDEASQMSLPEAIMAARLLHRTGRIVVVGDHRQMAPIVKHDWENERRRTFQQYRVYSSLFETLRTRDPRPPILRFEESFRLHADMARFLRDEVYVRDGIDYHSRVRRLLEPTSVPDDFVRAVLDPIFPLVVVTHDEQESQTHNAFEVALMTPVLEALSHELGLDARDGLGVVVPHRAQRAAFLEAMPDLHIVEADGHARSAVDTVEKFQGGERVAMVFAATESDPGYLASRADFLFDPRRLTVAMSRAKRKMILVASRTVFRHFSTDPVTFADMLLWKNLLRRTCTVNCWQGVVAGHHVTVWGNVPSGVDGVKPATEAALV